MSGLKVSNTAILENLQAEGRTFCVAQGGPDHRERGVVQAERLTPALGQPTPETSSAGGHAIAGPAQL
jgi:hypothetical protein